MIEFFFIVLTMVILSLGSQSKINNILKPKACINLMMVEFVDIQAFFKISIHSFHATIIFRLYYIPQSLIDAEGIK